MSYNGEAAFAIGLVEETGELMRDNLRVGQDSERKPDGTYVTSIDKEINKLVIEKIRAEFPDDAILGEEESDIRVSDKRLWICDPLDGTFNFVCGIPTSMIMLALIDEGEPKTSVAYNPYVRQLFTATQGLGAFVNGQKVEVNKAFTKLAGTPIGTTGPSPSPLLDIVEARHALSTAGAGMHILGATGYEDVMVGSGQFGAQIFGGNTRHDIAAGDLFVREAGGMATDIHGSKLTYDKPPQGAILSNDVIHGQLLDLIAPRIL